MKRTEGASPTRERSRILYVDLSVLLRDAPGHRTLVHPYCAHFMEDVGAHFRVILVAAHPTRDAREHLLAAASATQRARILAACGDLESMTEAHVRTAVARDFFWVGERLTSERRKWLVRLGVLDRYVEAPWDRDTALFDAADGLAAVVGFDPHRA